jgi:hypothetical protein
VFAGGGAGLDDAVGIQQPVAGFEIVLHHDGGRR